MRNPRQIAFWIILTASVLTSVWWIFHVPYQPDRVFHAIPSNATVVMVHQNLAGEWDTLFNNPLLLRCVKAAGVSEDDLASLSTNSVVRKWTEKLVSDQSVMAFVPVMGTEHKPALVAASWIGNQSRLLRWQMAWIKTRDLTPVHLDDGNLTIWLSREKFGNSNLRLSLALSEGLVLACISEDPIGVRSLLEAAENYPYRRTVADLEQPAMARQLLAGSPLLRHWGWFEANHQPVVYQLDLKQESLNLDMHGLAKLPQAVSLTEAQGTGSAMDFIGKTSDLAVLLPLSWVSILIPDDPALLMVKTIRELAAHEGAPTNALAFLALLDQDHNGRIRGPINKNLRGLIKGVKAPTLLLGLQVQSDAEADKRIGQMLEKINSQYGLELTAGPFEPESGLRMTLIQDSRKGFYGSFGPEERVAYAVRGNWLLIASNGSILKNLLSQPTAAGKNDWRLADMSTASTWANLSGIGQTLKNAAGVAKLATLLDSSSGSQTLREKLDQAGTAAAVLRELGQANLTVRSSDTGFQLKLVIGQ